MPKTIEDKWFIREGKQYNEQEFCSWIKDQIEKHPVVKQHHGKWIELIEWAEGNQYEIFNASSRRMTPVDLRVRKKMIVINIMKPLIEALDSKINLAHTFVGQPNSGEGKDIGAAQATTALLSHNEKVAETDTVIDDMQYDRMHTGNGCIRWYWDTAKAAMILKGKKVEETAGEVMCYSPNIFNVRPDPTAKKPSEMRWHIEIKEVRREDLIAAYGDMIDDEWLQRTGSGPKELKYVGLNEKRDEKDEDIPTYILAEFIERPSKEYKKGRFMVFVNDRCLEAKPNSNPDGELGYYYHYFKKSRKSFWAMGPLHFIQDIQRELNRMVSIQSEHIEAWRPKMAVPMGALARANSMTIDSFEIVELNFDKGEPRPITMPELSPAVREFRDYLRNSANDVANLHEVSFARLPQYASRAPASLYSMMLEQESVKLDPMIKRDNATLIEAARFRLKMMGENYDEKRMVKIMGEGKIPQIRYFKGADLHGNYDVELDIGVSLNQSTAVTNRLLMELWDRGVYGNKDAKKFLRLLRQGNGTVDVGLDLADEDRADRENQMFADNAYLPKNGVTRGVWVYTHDDHELHLEKHTSLAKSQEADSWDDERMEALQFHIDEHYKFYVALMKATQAMNAGGNVNPEETDTLEGAGDEEGPGGPPGPEPNPEGQEAIPQGSLNG